MFKLREYSPPRTVEDINRIMRAGNLADVLMLRKWWRSHRLQRTVARDPKDELDIRAGRALQEALDHAYKGELIDLEYKGHKYTVRIHDIDDAGPKIDVKEG